MEVNKPLKINNGKYYVVLVLFAVIVYWPLSLNILSLKNDAITYFLPWRYHVSESLQHGYFPFWSPYLYTGLPIHADIQSGVWNPVVFMVSLFTTYDMNVLQWETVLYILIAGIGFFKLSHFFFPDKKLCLLLSMSYMCCGFMIDSGSFIAWVTSAAYVPFVFLFFLRTLQLPSLDSSLKLAIASSLLFLAGYTSFFIITFYLLFLLFIVLIIRSLKDRNKKYVFRLSIQLLIAAVCCVVICSPALISYLDFFPYYNRGHGLSLGASQTNAFGFRNSISYFFPQASYKLHSVNDISSKNAYIGIVPLLFIFYSFKYKFTPAQKLISGLVALCFLFSLGDATPLHRLFYNVLPLANTFRHPATTRLFTSIGLLLLAGYGLNHFSKTVDLFLHKLIYCLATAISLFVFYEILFPVITPHWSQTFASLSPAKIHIKQFFDSSTFSQWVIIGGILQVFFLLLVRKKQLLVPAWIGNLICMTFLSMPFTLVSQHKPAEVNAFVHSFPKGFPLAEAWKNSGNKINDSTAVTLHGYTDFYAKTISIQDYIITPTINNRYGQLLSDTLLRKEISEHPFVYSDNNSHITLNRFSPNEFSIGVVHTQSSELHITQQYNRNWHAYANDSALSVLPDNIAFMKVVIPATVKELTMVYRPRLVIVAACTAMLVFLGCVILLIYFRWTRK